jgi:hypothetical protein
MQTENIGSTVIKIKAIAIPIHSLLARDHKIRVGRNKKFQMDPVCLGWFNPLPLQDASIAPPL